MLGGTSSRESTLLCTSRFIQVLSPLEEPPLHAVGHPHQLQCSGQEDEVKGQAMLSTRVQAGVSTDLTLPI